MSLHYNLLSARKSMALNYRRNIYPYITWPMSFYMQMTFVWISLWRWSGIILSESVGLGSREVTLSEYKRRYSGSRLRYFGWHAGRHLFARIYQINGSVYNMGEEYKDVEYGTKCLLKSKYVDGYTMECRYKALQYNTIMHTILQWQRHNLYEGLHSQKTPLRWSV